MVTVPPPSMTVSLLVGSSMVAVTVMVAGAVPQSKVTIPPAVSAVFSSASVHEGAVRVPSTGVCLLVSAAGIGGVHVALGGGPPPSTLGGGVPASPGVPPPSCPTGASPAVPPSPGGGVLPECPLDEQASSARATTAGTARRADGALRDA